jgi:F0F1-type ATP synthase membrane subunit c/vacuolar-type H+-ATPase subunit K
MVVPVVAAPADGTIVADIRAVIAAKPDRLTRRNLILLFLCVEGMTIFALELAVIPDGPPPTCPEAPR